ncbi:MAG TPA: hypothetical protein VIJ71_04140 [Mycobacteriales bacterium]
MKRIPVIATTAALVLVGAGTYALGHASGVDAGKKAGSSSALAGVSPADMALIRQLAGDRAVNAQHPEVATPSVQSDGCGSLGGNAMVKSAACADGVHGGTTPTPTSIAPVNVSGAVPAATAYLAWLDAHPQPNEPLLLTRLLAARAALPAGAVASGIMGSAADDADGEVQVTMHGALACVIVLAAKVDAGQCYGGANEDTGGGDYGPKQFPPAYVNAE